MDNYNAKDIGEFVNVGTGEDLQIKELARIIKDIVGFKGEVIWDAQKPDGTPKKAIRCIKSEIFRLAGES